MQYGLRRADPIENHTGWEAKFRHTEQLGRCLLGAHARQRQQHDEAPARLIVKFTGPIVHGPHTGRAQFRILDLMNLLVGSIDQLGVDPVAVHVFTAVFGARRAENTGLDLFRQTGACVAVHRAATDAGPADTAPRVPFYDPMPCAVRILYDPWRIVQEPPR
jgi:hypothetical protein